VTVARGTRRLRTLPAMHLLRRIVVGVPFLAGAAFAVALLLTPVTSASAGIPATTFRLINPSLTINPSIIINPCIISPDSCTSSTLPVSPPSVSTDPSVVSTTTTPETTTTSTTTATSTTLPRAQTNRLNRTGATLPDGSPDPADITADDGGLPIVVPIAAGAVLAAGAVAAVLVVRSRRA
jgi:hypothetical protein